MPQVSGNTILGAGGYGSRRGILPARYEFHPEIAHLAVSGIITTASRRNPYVWVAVSSAHWLSHQDPYRIAEVLGVLPPYGVPLPRPGGGGPGLSPISTDPPPSIEATGASSAQPGKSGGPASSSKRRSRPRRNSWERCPSGFYWDGKKCRKVGTGPNWY